ncbi:superoxide dismutase [Ni] [Thermodesulfobacteriota bacterium]
MKYRMSVLIVLCSTLLFVAGNAFAHCEIPCGIYDDEVRMSLIEDHRKVNEPNRRVGEGRQR